MKDYQKLIGMLAIAVAIVVAGVLIYLGIREAGLKIGVSVAEAILRLR